MEQEYIPDSQLIVDRQKKLAAIKKNAPLAAALLLVIVLVIVYALDADKRAYIKGIDNYYKVLNDGTSLKARFDDQELTQGGQAFLDGKGYSSVQAWYTAIQDYEIKQLSEKYGEGFSVQYIITKTEKLSEEELEEYHNSSVSTVGYLKAYRLTVKEHFTGSKSDGYETQEIIAIKNENKTWQYNIQRWTDYVRNREL